MDTLEQLKALTAQRKISTARLDGLVKALCKELHDLLEVGDRAELGEVAVGRVRQRSNCGHATWIEFSYGHPVEIPDSCYLDAELGREGYLSGDFSAPYRGPSRKELLLFAEHAGALLAKLAEAISRESAAAESGAAAIESGAAALKAVQP